MRNLFAVFVALLFALAAAASGRAALFAESGLYKFTTELLDARGVTGRLAVLPFEVAGGDPVLGRIFAARLNRALEGQTRVPVVSRRKLRKILSDHGRRPAGIVSQADLELYGRILGAKQLVVGSVTCAGSRGLVKAYVVAVSNGQVLSRASTPAKCR